MSDTYLRVCVLEDGHDGDHLPYRSAPKKDEFGNIDIAHPRCVHVEPAAMEEGERYRVVFQLIDPMMPRAGYHEVVKEHANLGEAQSQLAGLRQLEADGDEVRAPRIDKTVIRWETIG